MAFNAVLFGDNYKASDMELNGCINDTDYWENLYSGQKASVLLTQRNSQMTKARMVETLVSGLTKTPDNGLLYVNFSGHGTIVPPGIQSWVPDDFDFDKPETWFTYDELDRTFMKHEKRGVLVVVISDSCHSAADPRKHFRSLAEPKKTRNRFLQPPAHILRRIVSEPFNRNVLSANQDDILLSGCRREQTSADAYIDGDYHGAFTYSLSRSFQDFLKGRGPAPSYRNAVLKSRAWLATNGYDQVPGAAGDPKLLDLPFFTPIPVTKSRKVSKKKVK
jgi:hypothetical protein